MKKILLSIGLGLTLASSVFAADNTLDQLNAQVVSILAPFQNEATIAQLAFGAVETNDERAVKIALNGVYRKFGPLNMIELKVDNLSYNYGDGLTPTTILKGSFGIDITKLLTQDEINGLFSQAAEMIEALAKGYTRDYGDAASVKGVVTSTTTDAKGNYTGLTALISGKIDLTKLPEDKTSEDVIATNAVLSITLNVKTGLMIDAYLVSNPEYLGFKENQLGLKELLDKLLARDEEAMAMIEHSARWLDHLADGIVGNN